MAGPDHSVPLPELAFDELLGQLVDRAEGLRATQNRLRGLLAANTAIIGDLELPLVLRHIVEVACELVEARYGAIGVLAPVGGLDQFVHVGMEEGLVERIGHLPEGKGLLGALIDDPRPIRLSCIADDPRSVGFPAGHPPMASFLGVPIRVRNEVFGNLYLAEARSGEFSQDDEQVLVALAATAGVVIDNARLFEQSRRRQEWLEASMEIQQRLLATEGPDPLQLVADRARELADADLVTVVLPCADPTQLQVEVAAGVGAEELTGYTYPAAPSMAALALTSGEPVTSNDVVADARFAIHLTRALEVGPAMMIPLKGAAGVRGVLAVARRRGRRWFDESDLNMATAFAAHAAVALELAAARIDSERVRLLEDRESSAGELHDHVIQRLFAAGMSLQGIAALPEADRPARVNDVIDDIDDVIGQIRSTIVGLRGSLGPALN